MKQTISAIVLAAIVGGTAYSSAVVLITENHSPLVWLTTGAIGALGSGLVALFVMGVKSGGGNQ